MKNSHKHLYQAKEITKMEVFLIILAVCVVLAIWYFIAKEFYFIAQEKGYNNTKYLWLPFIFGLLGCLLVVALPDRGTVKKDGTSNAPNRTSNPISYTPLVKHKEDDNKDVIYCTYCNTPNPKNSKTCQKCKKTIL